MIDNNAIPMQTKYMQKPNILWIYLEDVSPWFGCYGDPLANTPNIDKFSESGVLFERVYATAPVCSASRSAVLTGNYQTRIGAHQHRSSRGDLDKVFLPNGTKTLPEIFKDAGYHTFNRGKDDYNFEYDRDQLYCEKYTQNFYGKDGHGHWKERKEGQPFFGQIQLVGGKYRLKPGDNKPKNEDIPFPPYYYDSPESRNVISNHYGVIEQTDRQIGEILEELAQDGLEENTWVFILADHGMTGLREKQFCYSGGLHVPLLIRAPKGNDSLPGGTRRTDLVSLIDVSATTLSFAGLDIPESMDSNDLFAADHNKRTHLVSARDRLDYTIDRIRSVRTDRYHYIRNYCTDRALMQPQYRDQSPPFVIQKELYEKGELDDIQSYLWTSDRKRNELYDVNDDPWMINNLAESPEHKSTLEEHEKILDNWIQDTQDLGETPESDDSLFEVLRRWGHRCINPEYTPIREKFKDKIPEEALIDAMRKNR